MSQDFDLDSIEKLLQSVDRQRDPVRWSTLMNMKGVILQNKGLFKESESAFISALSVDDIPLKCKILINFAKTNFFKNNIIKALELIERLFDLAKANKRIPLNLFLGYGHLLRGQIFYLSKKDEKQALSEFKKAEFYFEGTTDARGVGLSCLEIARIHIKSRNLTTAWNFLRKAENFLSRLGDDEKLGVAICKGIALYHAGKEMEAMSLLKEVYKEKEEFGKGQYLIDEILDVYLDTRSRMLQYQHVLL
jgi:tetratricopeptide (TPR) repeat protein